METPATTQTSSHKYTSNPFAAAATALGKALFVNPIATLLLAVLPLVLIIAAYALFVILATTLEDTPGLLIAGGIVLAVVALIVLVRATLGAIFVLKASRENAVTTAGKVMNKDASPFVMRFAGIILVNIALFILASILVGLIGSAFDDASAVVIVGAVIFLAALFVAVKWSLAPFVLVYEKTSVSNSLKRSWELTKGHFVEVLGAIIAQNIISGNGLLMVVGSVSGLDTRYHEIKAYKTAKAAKPDVHWMNWLLIILTAIVVAFYVWAISLAADSTNDLNDWFNDSSNSTSSDTDYCYFDDSFDYKCATSERACRDIEACKSMLDTRESLDDFYNNYDFDTDLQ